jgi:hypothetical protein
VSSQLATELPSPIDYLDFQESEPQEGVPRDSAVDTPLDIEACDQEAHLTAVAMAVFRAIKDQITDVEAREDMLLKARRFLTDPQDISGKDYDVENGDPLSKHTLRRQILGQTTVRNALLAATGRHRANLSLDPLEGYVDNQLRLHGGQVEGLRGLFFMWEG